MYVIEVFIEHGCKSCERALETVRRFEGVPDLMVRVYERTADMDMFYARGVIICPATCIDGKLVFYGEFTMEQLREYVHSKEQLPEPLPVQASKPKDKHKRSWLLLLRTLIAGFVSD